MTQHKISTRIFSIIGLIAGALLIIAGIYAMTECNYYTYSSFSSTRYGADFYTDTSEAFEIIIGDINRVGYLFSDVAFVMGLISAAAGLITIAVFSMKICSTLAPKVRPVYAAPQYQQPVQPAYQQPMQQMPAQPAYQQPMQQMPVQHQYQQPQNPNGSF